LKKREMKVKGRKRGIERRRGKKKKEQKVE
jgi:hypothetical protein